MRLDCNDVCVSKCIAEMGLDVVGKCEVHVQMHIFCLLLLHQQPSRCNISLDIDKGSTGCACC